MINPSIVAVALTILSAAVWGCGDSSSTRGHTNTNTNTPDADTNTPGTNIPDTSTNTPDSDTNTPDTDTNIPDTGTNTPDTGANIPDAGTVTFTMVYSDSLSGSCTPCHAPRGTGATAGRLDMSTQAVAYTNLQEGAAGASCKTSGLKRVVPGDAAMSLLVEKVASANPPCGTQMPLACGGAGTCLSAAQVQEIKDWINAGAKND